MTGFLFAFCMCVSLNSNSELFLVLYIPYLCVYLSLCVFAYFAHSKTEAVSRILFLLMNDTCDFKSCVALHVRIANRLVTDSSCQGGIVRIRGVCSRALLEQPYSSKALWRFRVSTSNSPSGRTWPLPNTPMCHIDHTYAQQGIRVCGDDHFQPPKLSDLFSRVF